MQRRIFIIGLVICMAGMLVAPNMALADIFMKQKHHTGSFQVMGQTQPARDTIQSIWITTNAIRNDSDKTTVLVRLDKQVVYMIDHSKKTYAEMPLNMDKAMDEMTGKAMTKEQKQAMSGMMQNMMKVSMTVTDTGENKNINNWNCRKYIEKMSTGMGPVNTELWATQDLKVQGDIFAKYSAIMMTMQPGLRQSMAQVMQETKKIKGVAVLSNTTSNMMGNTMKSSMQLLEFKEGTAPADITTIPAGYKKQSMR